jgi:phospholipid transport system substrate-binding protein
MGLRVRVAAGAVLIVLASLVSDAAAGAPADRLRQFFAAANAVIADEATATPQEKMETIRRLVRDLFAFREAAEHVLGAEWRVRTPAEQTEFISLFSDMAESSFVSALASRARLDGGAQVTMLGEEEKGASATVKTAVAARSGSEIQVDYRMRRLAGRWAVTDVDVDGVSLLDNYRAQARRMIDRWSYAGLLAEMRARVRGGPGVMATDVAALPSPAARPSQTAAAAGSTVVDVGVGPASGPVLEARAATVTSPVERHPVVSPEPLVPATPLVAPPVPAAASPPQPPRVPSAAPSVAAGAPSATTAAPAPRATAAPPPAKATTRSGSASVVSIAPARAGMSANVASPPSPTPSRPAPAKPQVVASKPLPSSFWVQVGAFRTLEAASHMMARLRDQPIVIDMAAAQEPLLRVLVGPFRDHARAAAALRGLKAKGFQPFIATID